MPFPRGELVKTELYRYFMARHEGELDPRPGMLERVQHPERKRPKPPQPAHPLCPERITLDTYLGGLVGMFSDRYHLAAALFHAMPAWLRFLESRQLIDAATSAKVLEQLRPLHASLLKVWEQNLEDPLLYREAQAWGLKPS